MTAPARLTSVRLQGFKSFAERTQLVFGAGVSAVVGPNGSGKSNLADALRWALGEQGRALRSRKAEDVIWAGSERRAAIGMAEVQLVLDNADGLLPVEFSAVELGRRLYRSGENEYLLNRQRVRLRDQVDLLDAAHLADNAFLFIGQGMVDQALALRPEERRPLFEEVAGVRRHERRRRRAEEQLVEALANLERVEDILAELRPQVRRLAAQAEQQASREGAAEALVRAILAVTALRWHAAARRRAAAEARATTTIAATDAALARLAAAEATASRLAASLATRGRDVEAERARLEVVGSELGELRLRDGRAASELEAATRERARLGAELRVLEADLATGRGRVAEPIPERDHVLESQLGEADRSLTEAMAELETLRSSARLAEADAAAVRRAAGARAAEAEAARRQLADAERSATDEAAKRREVEGRAESAAAAMSATRIAFEASEAAVEAAVTARAEAAERLEAAEAGYRLAEGRASSAAAASAGLTERAAQAAAAVEAEDGDVLARSALAAGGVSIAAGLDVEPMFRSAVDAALGPAARAFLVPGAAIERLDGSGTVVLEVAGAEASSGIADRVVDRAVALGGGSLAIAVRRDPTGAARALLARAVWLPDREACLAIRAALPAGWVAVDRAGTIVVAGEVVRLQPGDGSLTRRAEADRLAAAARNAVVAAAEAHALARAAAGMVTVAREDVATARASEAHAIAERRAAELTDRTAARDLEAIVRERAWHRAQADRLAGEVARLRAALPDEPPVDPTADHSGAGAGPDPSALATWTARVAELRTRRDELAFAVATAEGRRRDADHRRTTAEAAIGHAIARRTAIEATLAELTEREGAATADRDAIAARIADASALDASIRTSLGSLVAADAADRAQLSAVEAEAAAAREAVRSAEESSRTADREQLEATLALESIREGALVELSGIGEAAFSGLGLEPLGAGPGPDAESDTDAEGRADLDRLGSALDALGVGWEDATPAVDDPGPGRLATLRRRFHEFGSVNPFATDELAAVRARLDGLERQHADLRTAIERTRTLIAELDRLIAEQFRTTFQALETAFDARFQQLFGGGYARLALTDPADLSATGVEIVARPPGKKPQALAMLSGGERALTAVALLFAMLEVRPVPFCVLDEVDAALDEANVGRFTIALRELAARTQFIVITHNRGTIETADALYGVTVGEDSVSRIVSLRLEEATAIAEAARKPAAVPVGPGLPSAAPIGSLPVAGTSDEDIEPAPTGPIDPIGTRTG